jgi:hypothetical protein
VSVEHGLAHRPYVIDVVRIDRGYVAFRWAAAFGGAAPVPGNATLVEFYVKPAGEEVDVIVAESGFSALDLAEALRESEREGAVGNWRYELASLRTEAERHREPEIP